MGAHRKVVVKSMRITKDRSVVIPSLDKPAKSRFVPGHYAFIQVPDIDWIYHPFSIKREDDGR